MLFVTLQTKLSEHKFGDSRRKPERGVVSIFSQPLPEGTHAANIFNFAIRNFYKKNLVQRTPGRHFLPLAYASYRHLTHNEGTFNWPETRSRHRDRRKDSVLEPLAAVIGNVLAPRRSSRLTPVGASQ